MLRTPFMYSVGKQLTISAFCVALAACGGGSGSDASAGSGADAAGTAQSPVVGGVSTGSASKSADSPAASTELKTLAARFNNPHGVTLDGQGNLYVADTLNYTIRKITSSSVITLAGTAGVQGSADGSGAAARFSQPRGIATDRAGNVYVTDGFAIRKITPSGTVTTLAGSVTEKGNADGAGANARFNFPWGVAADADGNLYVADSENYLIRKITPNGVVTTVAGTRGMRGVADGTVASATFIGPKGIALDRDGNLYIADWFGPPAPNLSEGSTVIRKITPSGAVSTLAGNFGSESRPAQFNGTFAITADATGNVYVGGGPAIYRVAPEGSVSTVVLSRTNFASVDGLALGSQGNLYAADSGTHTISSVSADGTILPIAGKTYEAGSADVMP